MPIEIAYPVQLALGWGSAAILVYLFVSSRDRKGKAAPLPRYKIVKSINEVDKLRKAGDHYSALKGTHRFLNNEFRQGYYTGTTIEKQLNEMPYDIREIEDKTRKKEAIALFEKDLYKMLKFGEGKTGARAKRREAKKIANDLIRREDTRADIIFKQHLKDVVNKMKKR